MSHTLILTEVMETEVELTDEEYEEYLQDPSDFLDPYWGEMDTVERNVDHYSN